MARWGSWCETEADLQTERGRAESDREDAELERAERDREWRDDR